MTPPADTHDTEQGAYFVQIAAPQGIANEAELFRLAYGHDLDASAHEQLDAASAEMPVYGWRTVLRLGDRKRADAAAAAAERGVGVAGGAVLVARVIAEGDLTAEEREHAMLQLQTPEGEVGYGALILDAIEGR